MEKTFYIVNHGETNWDRIGRIKGQKDVPLNDFGVEQVENLIERLEKLPISYIYSSSLKRAMVTADMISKRFNLKVKETPLLKEVCFGEAEGKFYSELSFDLKKLLNSIYIRSVENDGKSKIHGSECFEEVFERFFTLMDMLPENEDNILLVSHSVFIKVILLKFLNDHVMIGNCACFSFKYNTETREITCVQCI